MPRRRHLFPRHGPQEGIRLGKARCTSVATIANTTLRQTNQRTQLQARLVQHSKDIEQLLLQRCGPHVSPPSPLTLYSRLCPLNAHPIVRFDTSLLERVAAHNAIPTVKTTAA